MGRPPKPGQEPTPRANPQGRIAGPFRHAYSARLTKRGWDALVAERKVMQDQVDRGEISPAECSYSHILERALLQHHAHANTAEGKAADLVYLQDLRNRWKAESPISPTAVVQPPSPTDIQALVRRELASALQSGLPGILQAIADGQLGHSVKGKVPAKKPKR